MPDRFALVIGDGPPKSSTLGDRYGLLPVMQDRLGRGSVTVLDDVLIGGEDPVLSRWLAESCLSYTLSSNGTLNSHAVIVLE